MLFIQIYACCGEIERWCTKNVASLFINKKEQKGSRILLVYVYIEIPMSTCEVLKFIMRIIHYKLKAFKSPSIFPKS